MRIKSNKKLALLVSMALTVGSTLAVNPMDVYAASVTWDAENSNYKVLVDENTTTFTDAGQAVDAVINGIASGDDKDLTIDFTESAWSSDFKKAEALVTALQTKEVTLQSGANVDLTYADGGKYAFTNGTDESKLTVDASNVLTINGNMDSVNVTVGSTKAAEIKVATDKTVNSIIINEGSANELKLTGDGTVTKLDAQGDIKVTATDTKLTEIKVAEGKTLTTTGAVTAGSITGNGNVTANGALNVTGDISAASVTTTGALKADSVTTTGNLVVGGNLTAKEVTADSVTLKGTAANSDSNEKITINANSVTLDTTSGTADNINKMNLVPKTAGGTVNVKVITSNGSLDSGVEDAIKAAAGDNVTISATSEAAEAAKATANEAIAKADEALKKAIPLAAEDANAIAQADPFATKLPSASDIAAVASPTEAQKQALGTAKGELDDAINKLESQIQSVGDAGLKKDLENKKADLENKKAGLSNEGLQAKAAELTAAVQQAGKTAAAPGVASARTATVVTNVMTANVTGRTSELRGFASAVDEGRPAPDNVWFQYKHTNMDADNGDVYGKSTVKTNNYQLGYDAKVGPNDYLGAYIGTTTGNVEFNAPAVTDRTDIDNAYDFGIYGTHMLPSDQYIDYMIHTGKFDSKYNGVTWGTKDTGAMIGYGAKIAQNDRLTWNPYIQLAYDKVSVDGYMAGPNYIASDDSNNWTAKLGINLLDVSGFYGGLAYSRGLSGSYNAYINGVPMPSQDNNANVLYMSLGYRANMSRNVFLDLSMEKTFADYNGWTAAGKVNFYF